MFFGFAKKISSNSVPLAPKIHFFAPKPPKGGLIQLSFLDFSKDNYIFRYSGIVDVDHFNNSIK
jgi:hypothetical protein